MTRVSLRQKLNVGLALGLALLVAVGAAGVWAIDQLVTHERRHDRHMELVWQLEELLSLVKDAETGARGFMLTGQELYLEPHRAAQARVPERLAEVRALAAGTPRHRARLDTLAALIERDLTLLGERIAARRAGGLDAAVRLVLTGEVAQVAQEIRRVVAAMQAEERTLAEARGRQVAASTRRALGVMGLGTALAVLIATLGTFLVNREIARRERAEAESTQLADIVEHAEDAVVRSTLDGVVTSWNTGAERLTGYRPEEAIGRPPTFFLAPEGHDVVPQLLKRLSRGERINQFEAVGLRKDGTRYDASMSLATVPDAAGRPVGVSLTVRDVTERKRLIRELEQALAQVKTISGLLPICASCKKVRDDSGYWGSVEQYVQEHTEAEFTHGLCPDCQRKLYPEYFP